MKKKLVESIYQSCEQTLKHNSLDFNPLKNKTLFIAGGTGFVGIWTATLVQFLNENFNYNTRIYLLARNPENVNVHAPHILNDKKITFLKNDVRRVFELPLEINYILHAACSPNSRVHSENPLETVSTIVDGTRNLLSAADRCSQLEKFVYLSSASIYGSQPWDLACIPENFINATLRSNSILSAYAEAKRFSETLCAIFRSQHRLPVVVARPFSFVGPFQNLESPWAINNFIQDALFGEKIKILGDGNTVRSYLYGSDVAYWMLTMLIYGISGETYNVGSNDEISMKSLAELIVDNIGVKKEIIFTGALNNRLPTSRLIPSVLKAEHELNLSASVRLAEAITKTIDWYKG